MAFEFAAEHEMGFEQERGGRRGGGFRSPRSRSFSRRPSARPAAWRLTRWRSPRSFGNRFFRDYLGRRHRRYRRPGFDGWLANVDGVPMFYRRSLWGGVVVDEPPAMMPPQDEPPAAPVEEPGEPAGDTDVQGAPPEEEITRSYRATLEWSDPVALSGALRRKDGGIYVVEKDGKPIYVGEAASFPRRWLVRLEVLRQLAQDTSPYKLRFARITAADAPFVGIKGSPLREAIEHTIIRGLDKQGIKLTNRTSIRPFMAGTIQLTHTGTRPMYILGSPAPVAGQLYENFGFA
jgi:hypothetical protein